MKRRDRRTDITVANAALHYMYFVRPKISGEYDTLMFLRPTNIRRSTAAAGVSLDEIID